MSEIELILATCSLVTKYLKEQDIPIPKRVATALMYGIETELCGYPREAAPLDDSALQLHLARHAALQGAAMRVRVRVSGFDAVCRMVEAGVVVLGSHELFHREQAPAGRWKAQARAEGLRQ